MRRLYLQTKLNFEEKGKIGLTTHCEFINALKIPITFNI